MSGELTVNPLRLSQPAGAALAFLGIKGCVPLWHGVQGCTAFAKILFIQHFREPMPFQTTALTQTTVVMGGDENIFEAVENIKKDARFVGILTTGVAETCGADMKRIAKELGKRVPGINAAVVNTPDFEGTLETGWAKACQAVLEAFSLKKVPIQKKKAAVFAGPYITPGEAEWLRMAFRTFGLEPAIFPDIGDSLFGRLSKADLVPSSAGGMDPDDIEKLPGAAHVFSIGDSMRGVAAGLADISGTPLHHFTHISDLAETDRFFTLLRDISGTAVPEWVKQQRAHLLDAMLDTQFYFHGRTAAVAGDPDFIARWTAPLKGIGAAVVPFSSVPAGDLPYGDLRDLKPIAMKADLLVGNSHVAELAKETGKAALRAGIPVYDRFGEPQSVRTGYEGTARLYMECANAFLENPPEKAVPYRSVFHAGLCPETGGLEK